MKNKKFWKWTNRTVPRASNQDEPGQFSGEEAVERVLTLNGTIAEDSWFDDDVTPQMFKDELNAGNGDITVWINSPGGDCVAAAQIYNMLSEYPGKVTVKVDGLAASVVAMAGNVVMMSPVSMMMIHNPATIAWGDHAEMQKAIELLDAVKESIINAYVMKTGLSRARLSHLMDAETWMDATKAVELGFADGILYSESEEADAGVQDAVMFSRRAVNNALVNKLEAKFGRAKKPVQMQAGIPKPEESCTGPTGQLNKVTGQSDSGLETGRSADELRERLNFIKKFI